MATYVRHLLSQARFDAIIMPSHNAVSSSVQQAATQPWVLFKTIQRGGWQTGALIRARGRAPRSLGCTGHGERGAPWRCRRPNRFSARRRHRPRRKCRTQRQARRFTGRSERIGKRTRWGRNENNRNSRRSEMIRREKDSAGYGVTGAGGVFPAAYQCRERVRGGRAIVVCANGDARSLPSSRDWDLANG